MEVLYHGITTRYPYDFPLCFPHELIRKKNKFTVFLIFFLTINPNPPCQLFRRTQRKSTTFGRVLTNSSHVRSDVRYRARTHDLSGGRPSARGFRRLSHRSPCTFLHVLFVCTFLYVPFCMYHVPACILSFCICSRSLVLNIYIYYICFM